MAVAGLGNAIGVFDLERDLFVGFEVGAADERRRTRGVVIIIGPDLRRLFFRLRCMRLPEVVAMMHAHRDDRLPLLGTV